MKNRVCCTTFPVQIFNRVRMKKYVQRHRPMLLGMMVFVIFCWMLSSIWLIGTRRSERSVENIGERKTIVTLVLPAEKLASR